MGVWQYGASVEVFSKTTAERLEHFTMPSDPFAKFKLCRAGQKKAREIWFLSKFYTAQEALQMGLINHVVPLEQLEAETVNW